MQSSRWDAHDDAVAQAHTKQDRAELSTDVNTNTEGQSPPPLPPDDPPPLPPSEDPWSSNLKAERSARAYSRWDDSGAAQSSSQDAKPFQVLQSAGNAGPDGLAADGAPPPPDDWQPPPPPAPPSPSGAQPWGQTPVLDGSSRPGGTQQDANAPPLPEGENASWSAYPNQGAAQASHEGHQWEAAWYEGYGYQQGYTGYDEYGTGPSQGYQQPNYAAGYAYQGQPGFVEPAYPWSNPQVSASQPSVPSKNEVDASDIFKPPGRYQRPAKVAVIMRGLPGSGKSHIAKRLKEIEVEHGGEAPRIHALDDYFVTEVEKEITDEQPGKKPKKRKITVMEYLYEQELEESYRASILKAFSKTVEEGRFPFVILDAPNIQVEDFRPFYMVAQRVGYEVFVLKPLDTDPEVCFKRNVHQRDQDTISDLAALYEPTPNLFTQILVESLFDLPKSEKAGDEAIEEVDMEEDALDIDEQGDQPTIKSRWSSIEDEIPPEEEEPKRKRKKQEEESQLETPPAGSKSTGKVARRKSATSILREAGGPPPGKALRWADQVAPAEGFTIGGPAGGQLEEVYLLEGLGPTPDANHNNLSHNSFVELARKERTTEKHSFKDILLGKRSL